MSGKKAIIFFGIVLLGSGVCQSQHAANVSKDTQSAIDVEQIISWLPSNTETLIVASGPFDLSYAKLTPDQSPKEELSAEDLKSTFEALPLALFTSKKGMLLKNLAHQQLLFAAEGSRHFRSPRGLGETPFEGCVIAVFADKPGLDSDLLLKTISKASLRTEEIQGQRVAVFQERLENDLWTTLVAFPQKDTIIVATDRDYLRVVLARMHGEKGQRALPKTLAEWKYVNQQAPFWGLRHFFREQAQDDPTSPFGGRKPANLPDEQAIGIVFDSDPAKERAARITYLSGDQHVLAKIEENLFPAKSERKATQGLHIQYHELAPGVIQGSYELRLEESISWFFFVLMGNLGHAVYL